MPPPPLCPQAREAVCILDLDALYVPTTDRSPDAAGRAAARRVAEENKVFVYLLSIIYK